MIFYSNLFNFEAETSMETFDHDMFLNLISSSTLWHETRNFLDSKALCCSSKFWIDDYVGMENAFQYFRGFSAICSSVDPNCRCIFRTLVGCKIQQLTQFYCMFSFEYFELQYKYLLCFEATLVYGGEL